MGLHVMVPLDGSTFAEQAIPHAIDIVKQTGGLLHLVKVHQPPEESGFGDAMYLCAESLDEEARDEEYHYLARVAASDDVPPVGTCTALINGSVVTGLNDYARSREIDLIVMSTHGRSGLNRAFLGSVAETLLRSTHLPALLIRPRDNESSSAPKTTEVRRILIPVDSTTFSESVIQTAIAIGDRDKTHYTLLQVVLPASPVRFGNGVGGLAQGASDELRAAAVEHINTIAYRLRRVGYSVDTAVAVAFDAAETIRSYAADHAFNLIAMTTHGRTGWRRLLMGSVADRVKRETIVPLLMVQPPA